LHNLNYDKEITKMKQLMKWTFLIVVPLLLVAVPIALAGSPGGPGGPGGGPGGVNGEVTAIGTNSLTVLTANSTSVTVTTNTSTTVQILATGATGSLSDIVVGSQVEVRGSQKRGSSIIAKSITLLPDGDQLGGRVTAIDGETITVQASGGVSATIVTTSATTFREGQDTASLSDVEVGQNLRAYGTLESDGSLTATLVLIQTAPGGDPGGPGGGPGGGSGGSGGGPGGSGGGPGGSGGGPGGQR
jgi:hypothetical protein